MRVQDWMSKEVISVEAETSVMKASRLMQENKLRRLAVVGKHGELIGILSDRDIKDASPSKATSLEVHELYYLLSEMHVKQVMTKTPISALPTDSIENVIQIMLTKKFSSIPVVDTSNKLCGMLNDSDLFKMLLSFTGSNDQGAQLAFLIDRPEESISILQRLLQEDIKVLTLMQKTYEEGSHKQVLYIRTQILLPEQAKQLEKQLSHDFCLLYCE